MIQWFEWSRAGFHLLFKACYGSGRWFKVHWQLVGSQLNVISLHFNLLSLDRLWAKSILQVKLSCVAQLSVVTWSWNYIKPDAEAFKQVNNIYIKKITFSCLIWTVFHGHLHLGLITALSQHFYTEFKKPGHLVTCCQRVIVSNPHKGRCRGRADWNAQAAWFLFSFK